MRHNQLSTYLIVGVAIAAVLALAGLPIAALLPFAFLLACPLMMIFMMRGMSGMGGEDHTGHGCEHDPTHPPDRSREPRN